MSSVNATAEPDWHALGLRDGSARSYYELGRVFYASRNVTEQDAAIKALNIAHELQPRARAYTELGIVLKARGRLEEAEAALRKAVKFTPNEPSSYLHLGSMVQPHEAVPLMQSAVRLLPSSGSAAPGGCCRNSAVAPLARAASLALRSAEPVAAPARGNRVSPPWPSGTSFK